MIPNLRPRLRFPPSRIHQTPAASIPPSSSSPNLNYTKIHQALFSLAIELVPPTPSPRDRVLASGVSLQRCCAQQHHRLEQNPSEHQFPPSSSSSRQRTTNPLFCLDRCLVVTCLERWRVDFLSAPAVGDEEKKNKGEGLAEGYGVCAICLERILIQEVALVKGCEHAYCVTCILRWATYHQDPSCPQCRHPFNSLNIHRSLDGCIHDYMFEESVCLLLRACWFVPLAAETNEGTPEEPDDLYQYYAEGQDDDDDDYFGSSSSSNIRIGNRRWGDNGYVRAGRKEACPVNRQTNGGSDAGPSRCPKKDASPKDATGRRAKRALKREAADKAAAAKHEQHLQRLGRK